MTGRRIVLVTGQSGAGRASILRALEDLGYEAVDNPPLILAEELATRGERPLVIGMDSRSRGFKPATVLAVLERLRLNPALRPELVFACADTAVLLRRFTETRRRHPLAAGRTRGGRHQPGSRPDGRAGRGGRPGDRHVGDAGCRALRRLIEQRFGGVSASGTGLTVSLMSFAYPRGLPREADLVFDARFLHNPHLRSPSAALYRTRPGGRRLRGIRSPIFSSTSPGSSRCSACCCRASFKRVRSI